MADFENPGYPIQFHTIVTSDDYILTLTRIPRPIKENQLIENRVKPAVLLVHGFLSCGEHWLMNSPDKVLPYRLADEGYDCWIGNLRGSPLSQGHAKIRKQSKSRKYWNFSVDEIGRYDIPSMIDFILTTTGNKSLSYIGLSMGNIALMCTLNLYPEYCSKINVMVALAPAVHGNHLRHKLFRLLITISNLLGRNKLIRDRKGWGTPIGRYVQILCPCSRNPEKLRGFCVKKCLRLFGMAGGQIEKNHLQKLSFHLPAPSPLKLFFHVAQIYKSGVPRHYNYGRRANLEMYGEEVPPEYEMSKCKIPVALFYSDYDEMCPAQDIIELSKELPNVIGLYSVSEPKFGHSEFIFGKKVNELVFDKVMEIMRGTEKVSTNC